VPKDRLFDIKGYVENIKEIQNACDLLKGSQLRGWRQRKLLKSTESTGSKLLKSTVSTVF